MPTVDERLASLEARVDGINDLRTLITELRGDMTRQFTEVREDTKDLRGEMNRRFTEVREDVKELRGDMKGIDQKVDGLFLYLDQKTDRQFAWLVGTQVTVLLAVVGALIGAYYR